MSPPKVSRPSKPGPTALKLFPAEIIPPAVFKAWRAVFAPDTLLLAVGGVGVDNIASYGRRAPPATASARRLQTGPFGGRNRQTRQRAGSRPQRLDFPGFLPHIQSNEVRASRSANVAREVYCFWGAVAHEPEKWEPVFGKAHAQNKSLTMMTKQNRGSHIRLTSHPGRGGIATRFPIALGRTLRRASAGRWSAP